MLGPQTVTTVLSQLQNVPQMLGRARYIDPAPQKLTAFYFTALLEGN